MRGQRGEQVAGVRCSITITSVSHSHEISSALQVVWSKLPNRRARLPLARQAKKLQRATHGRLTDDEVEIHVETKDVPGQVHVWAARGKSLRGKTKSEEGVSHEQVPLGVYSNLQTKKTLAL